MLLYYYPHNVYTLTANVEVGRVLGGPLTSVEYKSGQLMGATVVSSGDYLVVRNHACCPILLYFVPYIWIFRCQNIFVVNEN